VNMAVAKRAVPVNRGPLAAVLMANLVRNLARWCSVMVRAPRAPLARVPGSAIAASGALLAVSVASIFSLDKAASDWAQRMMPYLFTPFHTITDLGLSIWFLVPFGIIVLCLAAVISPALPRITQGVLGALAARFAFLFLAIAVPGLFVSIVKRLIGRARPYVGAHDNPFAYRPFGWEPAYASLPSGHATTVAGAAIAIGALFPRARPVLWLYALLIMFSRVVVLDHHPSDVIAGALVGAVGALLVRRWFAARGLVFCTPGMGAYPWPSLRRIKAAFGQAIGGAKEAVSTGPQTA
jgi:membrane-associated phospholipid phosphatase